MMEKIRRIKKESQEENSSKGTQDIFDTGKTKYDRDGGTLQTNTKNLGTSNRNRVDGDSNDIFKTIEKENARGKSSVSKSPRRSRKMLHEFGASVDVEDENTDELEQFMRRSRKSENENSNLRDSFNSKSRAFDSKPDMQEKVHHFQEENQQERSIQDVGDTSPNIRRSSNVKSGDNQKRPKSKSPVYLDELNKRLAERQERETGNSNKDSGVMRSEENDDDGDLASYFKGLFGREDRVTSTPKADRIDANKDKKDKRERKKGVENVRYKKDETEEFTLKESDHLKEFTTKEFGRSKEFSPKESGYTKELTSKESRHLNEFTPKESGHLKELTPKESGYLKEFTSKESDRLKDNTTMKEKEIETDKRDKKKKKIRSKSPGAKKTDIHRKAVDSNTTTPTGLDLTGKEKQKRVDKHIVDSNTVAPTFLESRSKEKLERVNKNTIDSDTVAPSLFELMGKEKQERVNKNTVLNTSSNIMASNEENELYLSNRTSLKDANDGNWGVDPIEDIFEVNNNKKKLQRQINIDDDVKSKDNMSVSNKSQDNNDKKNNKRNKLANDEVGGQKLKLNVSFDDQVEKEKGRPASADADFASPQKKKESFNMSTIHSKPQKHVNMSSTVPLDSTHLKDMVYKEWLEGKKVQHKKDIKAKMLAQKKAAKDAEEKASERKLIAKKTFEAWNESKTEVISTQKENKKETRKTEKEKIEESVQKKKDAEKTFERWKQQKDEKLKMQHSQKKKEEKEKGKEAFQLNRQKSEDALKAFEGWKTKKEKDLVEAKKRSKDEKVKSGEEKLLEYEKKQKALRAFEEWKSINTSPKKEQWNPQLTQKPWSPASRNLNNTIPEKVQPVVLRKQRTMSR